MLKWLGVEEKEKRDGILLMWWYDIESMRLIQNDNLISYLYLLTRERRDM